MVQNKDTGGVLFSELDAQVVKLKSFFWTTSSTYTVKIGELLKFLRN